MLAGAAMTSVFAGGTAQKKESDTTPVIAVSILPQQYFLERIGGNRITSLVLVGPGQDPHSYNPTPKQMVSLSSAKAWILSAVDFEIGLKPKIASQYPDLLIVDGTEGVVFRKLDSHVHASTDGAQGELDGSFDRHTWLGSGPAKIMAGHIRDVLVRLDPTYKDFYEANYRNLIAEIDSVYGNLRIELFPLSGKKVLVFHPSFGYFLDEFSMIQEAIETGGKEPSAKSLASMIEEAKKDKPSAIFVQAQFPVSAAKTVADSVGAEVVFLDPLSPDWLSNIKYIGASLEKALVK